MPTEEQIKQKYMEFKVLQEHIQKINEHMDVLKNQTLEINSTKEAIKEFAVLNIGSEILVPIADGIFIKGELKNNKDMLINVGADTVVERSIFDVMQLIEEQQSQAQTRLIEAQALLEEFEKQAMKIYEEVESHVREA